jgi:restriction endonuclease Mrr
VNPLFVENVFFGELPPEGQLHDYYVGKHGKLRGLNRLFPRRIQNSAAIEWVAEQLEKQRAHQREQRARDLWERYYCMSDERHVSAMSGAEFERFIGKLYTRLGYRVSLTHGGADQGVDLILSKDGQKIAVQAKRWTGVVGNKAVQEVIAGKLYYGCSHAWIVTSSTFSINAVGLAAKDPTISVIDGRALSKLCEQFKTAPTPEFSWNEWEKIKHIAERFA